MSDGSSKSRFVNPEPFVELGRIKVFDGDKRVENLNELEFVDRNNYVDVLPQDRIGIVQPETGKVTGWIDLAELKSRMPPLPTDAAYDAAGRRLFVAGKLWPKVFEDRVRLQ